MHKTIIDFKFIKFLDAEELILGFSVGFLMAPL